MRRYIFLVMIVCLSVAPAWADPTDGAGYSGGTASWTRAGGYYVGNGGEFTFGGPSLTLSNSAYAATTSGVGSANSFQTFCIEADEYIWPGEPVNVWVSTANAANTGPGSHAWLGGANTNSGDDLDPLTAYIYTQFAKGTLTGYAYSGTVNGLSRAQTAAALQRTFWNIEQEDGGRLLSSSFEGITLNTAQQTLAQGWLDTDLAGIGWSGIGDVRVLQNWYTTHDTCYRQDQLFLTPIPAAVWLGMLGLSAAGLKLRKRSA